MSPASAAKLYSAYRADLRRDQYTALRMSVDKEGKPLVSAAEARKVSAYGPDRFEKYQRLRDDDKRTADEAARASRMPEQQLAKYRELRNSGMWVTEAEAGSKQPAAEVKDAAAELKEIARAIAKGNGVRLRDVMRGMSFSDRTVKDWEEYIRRRKAARWVPQRQVEGAPGLYKREPKSSKAYRRWARRHSPRGKR